MTEMKREQSGLENTAFSFSKKPDLASTKPKEKLFSEELMSFEELLQEMKRKKDTHPRIKKIDITGVSLYEECSEELVLYIDKNGKINEEAVNVLSLRFLRVIESCILDLPEEVVNLRAEAFAKKKVEEYTSIENAGPAGRTKEGIESYQKKQFEQEYNNINSEEVNTPYYSAKRDIFENQLKEINKKYSAKITHIVTQAVKQYNKEIEQGKNSLAQEEKKKSWYNFKDRLGNFLSSMFRNISLSLGAEPTAKELFSQVADYAKQALKSEAKKYQEKNKRIINEQKDPHKGAFKEMLDSRLSKKGKTRSI